MYPPETASFANRLKWLSLALFLQGAAALVYLASLPTSEKGLSTPRLAFLGLLVLLLVLLGGWAVSLFALPGRLARFVAAAADRLARYRFEALLASGLAAVCGVYLIIRWSFLPATYEYAISLPRLYPALILLTLLSAEVFLLALAAGQTGGPKQSLVERIRRLAGEPARLPRLLALLAVGFGAASLAGQAVKYGLPDHYRFVDFLVQEFYMDGEFNLPSFYSSALMLAAALLMGVIAWAGARTGRPFRAHWIALGLIFVFLAIDETFSLHEMLTEPVQDRIYAVGVLYWPWFLPILPLLAVLFLAYLRFLRHLPRKTFWLVMASAGLFLGAAIVLEALGAAYADEYGLGNFPYTIISTGEELTELSGLILLIYTLLDFFDQTEL